MISGNRGQISVIAIVGLVAVGIMLISGGAIAFKLSQIPAFVWVLLGAILLFKIAGGKKK